jgi:RNA polymerase sigma factor (sigma-70 family)
MSGPEVTLEYAMNLAAATVKRMQWSPIPWADAEDWYAVGRLAALQAMATYDPTRGARLPSWIITKVRFALKDLIRAGDHLTRKHRESFRSCPDAAPPPPIALEPLLELHADDRESPLLPHLPFDAEAVLTRMELAEALKQLTPLQQQVVHMRLWEALEFEEISAKLGRSKNAAGMVWKRAIRELRLALKEQP